MATIPLEHINQQVPRTLPKRGTVAMAGLITAESAIFTIFVVAIYYYVGRDVQGPKPKTCSTFPFSIPRACSHPAFLSGLPSAPSIAARWQPSGSGGRSPVCWGMTFLYGTATEWRKLIVQDKLTISTNLFGTTYYSLVGLHASHVVVGLIMMLVTLVFALAGAVGPQHAYRVKTLAIYWHFVDAVWVVVFTVVYVVGR